MVAFLEGTEIYEKVRGMDEWRVPEILGLFRLFSFN